MNNILFLMTDHQRADSIHSVQSGEEVTPVLNRLAAGGTRFTRAYNVCPLCVPARTALATGRYPSSEGVVYNDWEGKTAQDQETMHECLAEAGYDVAHVGIHHIRVKPDLQERLAFSKWITADDYRQYLRDVGIGELCPDGKERWLTATTENKEGEFCTQRYSNSVADVWPHAAEHFQDSYFAAEATEFIRRDHTAPWAAFVCLWAPHPPLRVPEPYASIFDPAGIDLPDNVGQPAKGEPSNRRAGVPAQLAAGIGEEEWRLAWAAHLGLVRLADDRVGELLDALRETNQENDTTIVFTSDHGEHLGQHAMYQKMEMYEQAVNVPLILSGPGIQQNRVDTPVSHLDLFPSLLELAGISLPDGLDGSSLFDTVTAGIEPEERPLFCQYSGNYTYGDCRRAVITRNYKYIYDPQAEPELYDLRSDPLEMRNLAGRRGMLEMEDRLRSLCLEWIRTRRE
jgi:arylsulfatase A-like enzyme